MINNSLTLFAPRWPIPGPFFEFEVFWFSETEAKLFFEDMVCVWLPGRAEDLGDSSVVRS